MGKLWVAKTNGRRMYLPVAGDDINTPNTAIPISLISGEIRNYGEPIVLKHPTFGTITIDLRTPGIVGSCNRCGACCTHRVEDCPNPGKCRWSYDPDIDRHKCPHLQVDDARRFGEVENAKCALYANILDHYKGCAYPPDTIDPLWANCGYRVEE